jgi:transcriptional regulator with XRE-family HTH domain/Zn-dependent peptidase ImmA (M78 family)
MSIKERIISKRKALGLNQTELAKRAGLQPPAISQYESGIRNPSFDALIKLSNALNVSVDFLVSGVEHEENSLNEPRSGVLLNIFKNLDSKKKDELIHYAFLSAGYENVLDFFSNDPKQYAQYVFEKILNTVFPIDIYSLANMLNLKIIDGDLGGEAEALLLKPSKTIILDKNKMNHHTARIKFSIATLVGHYLIPWHTQNSYYYRKLGKSTLQTENIEEMEASSFAASLITPSEILEKDLSKLSSGNVSLTELKVLAYEKYEVSLTSLCNRLIEYDKNRFALVNSNANKIMTKVYSGMIIKEEGSIVDKNSKAFQLLSIPSENEEELKEGIVNAGVWMSESEENELLYESSIYNRKYKSVLTLLTKIE